jgi:hypothetical protein
MFKEFVWKAVGDDIVEMSTNIKRQIKETTRGYTWAI